MGWMWFQALFASEIQGMPSPGDCPFSNCSSDPNDHGALVLLADPEEVHLSYMATPGKCLLPQYHIFTFILAMISLASFLKLNYIVKTAILLVMVVVYTTLMLGAFPAIFAK